MKGGLPLKNESLRDSILLKIYDVNEAVIREMIGN